MANLFLQFESSLSKAFAQKADTQKNGEENDEEKIITPIVNSKFQETAFQRAFNANAEDIANSSFDASILSEDGSKYLVGIKSFGYTSGDQKIAQFKGQKLEWGHYEQRLIENAKGLKTKAEVFDANHDYYLEFAKEIARLRNDRIRSSKAQLRGFDIENEETEDVYHVLMPAVENNQPVIYVGETSYTEIDIDNIEVEGAASPKTPGNFKFTDGVHTYKYAPADSQLFMTFNNKEIVVDTWNINYVEDAFYLFENLGKILGQTEEKLSRKNLESYSWLIKVQPYSGFNSFYGVGSKMLKKIGKRKSIVLDKSIMSGLIELNLRRLCQN